MLRKLQNFSVCGADLFRVNRVYFRFSISALRLWHESMFNVIRRNPFFCKCSWSESTRGTAPFRPNNQAVKKSPRDFISNFKYNYVYTLSTLGLFFGKRTYSCNAIRVVSPKVIYLYRKCKEFDLNYVSNRALTLACKYPGVVSPLLWKCASFSSS